MKRLLEPATPFISIAERAHLIGHDLPWLQTLRHNALNYFASNGLPSRKEEDWKYTSLWQLSQRVFDHHCPENSVEVAQIDQLALLDNSYRLVIIDGVFSTCYSQLQDLPAGVAIRSLSTGLEYVEPHLGKQVDINKAGLNALNTALMNDGAVIVISSGVHLDTPIEIIALQTGQAPSLATHLRHMIMLAENSKATVLEHYASLNDAESFTNVVTEVVLAEQAALTHYKLQQESANAFHIATLATQQAANSEWLTNNTTLGGKLTRNDIHSQLSGKGAHVVMNGLYLADSQQHIDNHLYIDHAVANTGSNILYKGVLDDSSHGVFNGKVMVHKDAQKTDASQYNHNLLLSRTCEIDTKPEMEIYADDVKCGHGSTVGQLSNDNLFFLRARGLDEPTARAILMRAFVMDVMEQTPETLIREAVSAKIEEYLLQKGDR